MTEEVHTIGTQYRQGDVLLVAVGPILREQWRPFRETNHPADRVVLAFGEATGHMHQIKSRAAEVYRMGGARFLHLGESASLTHEEHGAVELPAGSYQVVQQRELTGREPTVHQD
jgi:hypothetical protein